MKNVEMRAIKRQFNQECVVCTAVAANSDQIFRGTVASGEV